MENYTRISNISPFKAFNEEREKYLTVQKKELKQKKLQMALMAGAGAILPLAIYNTKKGNLSLSKDVFSKNIKGINKLKNLSNFIEIDSVKQIGISVLGTIVGGLTGGILFDEDKNNKIAKTQEAIYSVFNCMGPISIIGSIEAIAKKNNKKIKALPKAGIVAGGVLSGMAIANKIANTINKKIFKKDDYKKREMKFTDCFVHMDDIIGVLVLAGAPHASILGKFLPFIYSHCGYEVAQSTKTTD